MSPRGELLLRLGGSPKKHSWKETEKEKGKEKGKEKEKEEGEAGRQRRRSGTWNVDFGFATDRDTQQRALRHGGGYIYIYINVYT